MTNRNAKIDIMKGVGILCVILGHIGSLHVGNLFYSFHMPLFFIISGYLYKERSLKQQAERDAQRLLMPYFYTFLVCLAISLVLGIKGRDYSNFYATAINGITANDIGAIWFLPALFWSKQIMNVIQHCSKYPLLVGISISIIAAIICQYWFPNYLGICQGTCALIFCMIGKAIKETGFNISGKAGLFGIAFWIWCVFFSSLDICSCHFRYYPISIAGACGGCYAVLVLVRKVIMPIGKLEKAFNWLGQNSLLVLCFQSIDGFLPFCHWLKIYDNVPLMIIYKVGTCIIAILLFKRIKRIITMRFCDKNES